MRATLLPELHDDWIEATCRRADVIFRRPANGRVQKETAIAEQKAIAGSVG